MWLIMVSVAALVGAASAIPCEEARLKCAYRVGCGMALNKYIMGCSGVLQGPPTTNCPEVCQYSLISLTSTKEGKDLMNCECSDSYCEGEKLRTEICRPQVLKSINEPVVSCRVAQSICEADALCSTALEYYNRNCKAMFNGKKCTPRCINSINILRRQDKAEKLATCRCDGKEHFQCHTIQRNMDKLCFHKHIKQHHHHQNHTRTQHEPSGNRPADNSGRSDIESDRDVPTVVLASSGSKGLLSGRFSFEVVLLLVTVLIT